MATRMRQSVPPVLAGYIPGREGACQGAEAHSGTHEAPWGREALEEGTRESDRLPYKEKEADGVD